MNICLDEHLNARTWAFGMFGVFVMFGVFRTLAVFNA
jgi:hypothetical protein